MFFFLSKTLYYVLMPIFWILLSFILGLWHKNPKKKHFWLSISLGLLLFFTNPFLVNQAFLWWEEPPKPLSEIKNYDVGIVLTGITIYDKSPHDRVYFDKGADRVLHTLHLYRLGKIKKILITGGTVTIWGKSYKSEAQQLAEVLRLANIPPQDIILEEKARNTRENAQYATYIVQNTMPPNTSCLLITSAFHLPRAKACFQKAGLKNFETFAVDFHSTDISYTPASLFLPSEKNLYRWYVLIHEIVGFLTYKIMGYA